MMEKHVNQPKTIICDIWLSSSFCLGNWDCECDCVLVLGVLIVFMLYYWGLYISKVEFPDYTSCTDCNWQHGDTEL